MTTRTLTDGSPVPEDQSHTDINPVTGQQRGYVVLSAEERAKGFVKPVRRSYQHTTCGGITTMGTSLAETYARDPYFYSGTFCATCQRHFPLDEFDWEDSEPMDTSKQAAWAADREAAKRFINEQRAQLTARQQLGVVYEAMHAAAPLDFKCADCTMGNEPCPICYAAWWQKRHPHTTQVGSS